MQTKKLNLYEIIKYLETLPAKDVVNVSQLEDHFGLTLSDQVIDEGAFSISFEEMFTMAQLRFFNDIVEDFEDRMAQSLENHEYDNVIYFAREAQDASKVIDDESNNRVYYFSPDTGRPESVTNGALKAILASTFY